MSTEAALCPACKTRPALKTGNLSTSWDTCEICTGLAVQRFIKFMTAVGKDKKVRPVQMDFNLFIGSLDRLLSMFLAFTEMEELDEIDAQTLKHHADDLIGVGEKALKTLAERMATT